MELIQIIYKISLLVCAVYGLHRFALALTAFRFPPKDPVPSSLWNDLPRVTIQLPMYNELSVLKQLLDAAIRIEYPRDRLQIQVLDDSTDETTAAARRKIEELKAEGHPIELIHRPERNGFKAGALANGLLTATGEFVAVFDADFIPAPDFLKHTIHFFTNPSIGMVQVRWAHQNAHDSLLTRLQSVLIDGHFLIDQFARFQSGRFFNFNGSGGIWRKRAIEDSGGWQADTLAEDLDLSYRAQIQGWKFTLLSGYQVQQELPNVISALRQQQFRWSKGSLQVGMKILPRIWQASLPVSTKLEATFHLTNTFAYIFVLLTSLMMLPMAVGAAPAKNFLGSVWIDTGIFLACVGSLTAYYILTQKRETRRWLSHLWFFPVFIGGIAGLSLVYIKAAVEVLINKKTPFIRTPKKGIGQQSALSGLKPKVIRDPIVIAEILMAAYLSVVLLVTFLNQRSDMAIFLILMVLGYYYIVFLSISEFFPALAFLRHSKPKATAV